MSTAEKLKALDATMRVFAADGDTSAEAHRAGGKALNTYRRALPQLLAVVEAAEAAMQTETVSALDEDDYTVWYDQPADRAPLAAALAALDEALT